MNSSLATLSLAAGLLVSAGALYCSNDAQLDACRVAESRAIAAAQAPIKPESTGQLGFTPMDQFNKVYPPACIPPNTNADVFSALSVGAFVSLCAFFFGRIVLRIKPTHMEKL